MDKFAARYASQPTIDAPPLQLGGAGRTGGLMPLGPGVNLGQAFQARQAHPNPAAHPRTPQPALATVQGIQQHVQKLALDPLERLWRKRAMVAPPAMGPPPALALPPPSGGGAMPPQASPPGMPPGAPPGAPPGMPPGAPPGMPPGAAPGAPPGAPPGMPPDPTQGGMAAPPGDPNLQPGFPTQPPLPANPRPNPPRPETSQDALQQADWLSLAEDKNSLPTGPQAQGDLQSELLGAGDDAGFKSAGGRGRWLAFLKRSAQDNSKPQRSATGESAGLSYQHKPDHYLNGPAAWDSVGQYLKGGKGKKPDLLIGKHAAVAALQGLLHTAQNTAPQAARQLGAFGDKIMNWVPGAASNPSAYSATAGRLAGAAHDRVAHYVPGTGTGGLASELPDEGLGAATQMRQQGLTAAGAPKIARDVSPFAAGFLQAAQERGWSTLDLYTRLAAVGREFGKEARDELAAALTKSAALPGAQQLRGGLSTLGRYARPLGRMLGYGVAGSMTADELDPTGATTTHLGGLPVNPLGFAAGAALGHRGLGRTQAGRALQRPASRAFAGGLAGMAADQAAAYAPEGSPLQQAGNAGTFGRLGAYGGLGLGAAQTLARSGRAGIVADWRQARQALPQFVESGMSGEMRSNINRTALGRLRGGAGGALRGADRALDSLNAGTMAPLNLALRTAGYPFRSAGNLGRTLGWAPVALGAGGAAYHALTGGVADSVRHGVNQGSADFLERGLPYAAQQLGGQLDQYLGQRGLLQPDGSVGLGGAGLGRAAGGALGHVDDLLRRAGLNPEGMSPLQRLSLVGGVAGAGLGGLAGSPLLAGGAATLGALGTLAGGRPQGGNPWQQPQQQAPAGGPVNQPAARDEYSNELRLTGQLPRGQERP